MKLKILLAPLVFLLIVFIGIGIRARFNLQKRNNFFSIVVLPDTQRYSYEHHDIFCSQTEWIVKNKESLQ